MLQRCYLREVPLPDGLTGEGLFTALQKTQSFFGSIRENAGINLSSIIQANNFSGVVSNVFTKVLGESSAFQLYHDQRYPDLWNRDTGIGLEVKASNKPMKGGEGHNGHSGWHIIVCFHLLENGDIEFSQVEIANLFGFECADSDWTYHGSKRNANQSQRTETYVTTKIGTAKLRDGSVYLNPELVPVTNAMIRNRESLSSILPVPPYSPLRRKE